VWAKERREKEKTGRARCLGMICLDRLVHLRWRMDSWGRS
jgi:hypothetical protein